MSSWIFPDDAFLVYSPLRKQLDVSQELRIRESIYDFIIRVGSSLKLSPATILAATVYIHRFYMRYPVTTSKYFVACAALAILSKLNDSYRPPDKIAMAGCILKTPNKHVDEHSDVFWQWRDQLFYREEVMLRSLNFDLNVDLPYDIRDKLMDADIGESSFSKNIKDILKNVVATIELLSSLPVLVCYDMKTVFGAILIITTIEAREKMDPTVSVPEDFIPKYVGADVDQCWKCYSFILKLLIKCDSKDPKTVSHRNCIKKIPALTKEEFYQLVGASF